MIKPFFAVTYLFALLAGVLSRLLVALVFLVVFTGVALRFLFSTSLYWSLEASIFGMIWAVMLASSLLVRDRELISVDFFDNLWPERARYWRDAIFQVLLSLVLVVLLVTGYNLAVGNMQRVTPALQISWFWVYLSIPVGAALMLLQMLHRSVCVISNDEAHRSQV